MGAGLCDRCAQLLEDFVALVRRASRELARKIEECVKAIAQCCCLKRRTTASRTFYRPLVQEHERQAARELLQHLDTGSETPLLSSECLHALNTLAVSENHELQRSASVYLLHLSQQLPTPLPSLFLEPYPPLLRSCDLDVQRMASLSLVNLLVERNVNKELVVEMGLLEPVMDMLESGDPTIQCNSCACVAMLATSDSNREAIASADGVLHMLVLAKSYDPRVQQNAVGALLNLTRSERVLGVLCREGGLPVLVLLLQSADSEVQFYSCSALSNIAAVREYHPRMLGIGDRFLLKSLLCLASSPVEKNSCEALRCLRNLSVNGRTQEELMALGCVSLLATLLRSPAVGVSESAISLLSALSQHPPNRDTLVEEGLLQTVGELVRSCRSNTTILSHGAVTIANLSVMPTGQQAVMDSACLSGLLEALPMTDTTEEALLCVTSCLHRLATLETLRPHVSEKMTVEHVSCLVSSASHMENPELSFNAASIIRELGLNAAASLRPHSDAVLGYLLRFLKTQEVRFQQLAIATLSTLRKDGAFAAAVSGSAVQEQLLRVQEQTDRMSELLRAVQPPPPTPEEPPSAPGTD